MVTKMIAPSPSDTISKDLLVAAHGGNEGILADLETNAAGEVTQKAWRRFVAHQHASDNGGLINQILEHLLSNLVSIFKGDKDITIPAAYPDPDAELTEAELELIQSLYTAVDVDGSGELEKQEVLDAVAGGDGSGLFTMLDKDGNNQIDLPEFEGFFLEVKKAKGAEYTQFLLEQFLENNGVQKEADEEKNEALKLMKTAKVLSYDVFLI